MSDYEVTLVNDNSNPPFLCNLISLKTDSYQCTSPPSQSSPDNYSQMDDRQEFYVRFKGPEESRFSLPHPASMRLT
jgi:hypothetical protein